MNAETLKLSVSSDLDLFSRDYDSTRILEIAVEAPKTPPQSSRPHLNLALVIDRSGSMSGEKIEFAKRACTYVLDMLTEGDRAALVAYDDQIELHSPSVPVNAANRSLLKERVGMLRSRGSTNLFDGWQMGCGQAAEAAQDGSLNRVLLLTDGLANVGLTDPEILATHAGELYKRLVSTSTFGIGLDYDHNLLEGMANRGGGHYYYIENPRDIPRIFEAEFKELAAAALMDVQLSVHLPEELGVEVLGGWSSERSLGKLTIHLGALYGGRREPVYLRLNLPAGMSASRLELQVGVRARLASGAFSEAGTGLVLRAASQYEIADTSVDEALMRRYSQVELAEKAAEALKLEQRGLREQAHVLMCSSVDFHASRISPDLADEYKQFSEHLSQGLDEQDRKSSHDQSYQRRRNRAP
jgi:Ca-activated chloride channel family protein